MIPIKCENCGKEYSGKKSDGTPITGIFSDMCPKCRFEVKLMASRTLSKGELIRFK